MAQGTLAGRLPTEAPAPAQLQRAMSFRGSRARNGSERVIGAILFLCGALSLLTTAGIIFVLLEQAVSFFLKVPIRDFLFGTTWTALFKDGQFGVVPLVTATLLLSVLSMILAIPLGLMAAIYMSEYASSRARSILKPILELLAGIPTIVYGYFALTFLTPSIFKPLVQGTEVYNVLAAAAAVGIMVLPMVASLSEDALQAVPRSQREAGYAMGGTKLEVSWQIVVPSALSGIVAACILAVSRAVGETMIVALAMGSRARLSLDPRLSMQAMTSYVVQVVSGDVVSGSVVYKSLFAVGLLLFVMTLLLNIVSQWFVARYREVYQ